MSEAFPGCSVSYANTLTGFRLLAATSTSHIHPKRNSSVDCLIYFTTKGTTYDPHRYPVEVCVLVLLSRHMTPERLTHYRRIVRKVPKRLKQGDMFHVVVSRPGWSPTKLIENRIFEDRQVPYDLINRHFDSNGPLSKVSEGNFTSADLTSSLLCAFELLRDSPEGTSPGRMKRLIVLSDCPVSFKRSSTRQDMLDLVEGFVSPSASPSSSPSTPSETPTSPFSRVTLSTIGVGPDCDEELLEELAEQGRGHFHFVSRDRDLGKKMSKELHGMTTLLRGRDGVLEFFPLNSCQIESVEGCPTRMCPELRRPGGSRSSDSARLGLLGDVHLNETRQVRLCCRVNPVRLKTDLLEVRAKFLPVEFPSPYPGSATSPPQDRTETVVARIHVQFSTNSDDLLPNPIVAPAISSISAIHDYAAADKEIGKLVAKRSIGSAKRKLAAKERTFKDHMGKDPTGHLQRIIRIFYQQSGLLKRSGVGSVDRSSAPGVGKAIYAVGCGIARDCEFGYESGRDSDMDAWSSDDDDDDVDGETTTTTTTTSAGGTTTTTTTLSEPKTDEIHDIDFDDFDDFDDFEGGLEGEGGGGGTLIIGNDEELDSSDEFDEFDDDEGEGEVVSENENEDEDETKTTTSTTKTTSSATSPSSSNLKHRLSNMRPSFAFELPSEDDSPFAGLMSPNSSGSKSQSFQMKDPAELIEEQKGKIRRVAEVLSTTVGVAGNLLKHFHWNDQRLCEEFVTDQKKVVRDSGVTITAVPYMQGKRPEMECFVCMDDFPGHEMFSLACGHYFCIGCWKRFLHVKIADGPSCLLTLCQFQGCGKVVDEELVKVICDDADIALYDRYLLRSFIDDNPKIKWCPAPDCGKAVYVPEGTSTENVECSCGTRFCFQCGEEAHQPVSCENLTEWRMKQETENETTRWILENTKLCPECKRAIEKNEGCNHMTCSQCKHEFCWICMDPWSMHGQHTGGYFSCNRFDEAALKKKLEDEGSAGRQLISQRYQHYHTRYMNHHLSAEFERRLKQKVDRRMTWLRTHLKYSAWADQQYMDDAVSTLFECRRALKFTYVHCFYLEEPTEKALFEFLQSDLEAETERLSGLLESTDVESWNRRVVVDCSRAAATRLENLFLAVKNGLMDGSG